MRSRAPALNLGDNNREQTTLKNIIINFDHEFDSLSSMATDHTSPSVLIVDSTNSNDATDNETTNGDSTNGVLNRTFIGKSQFLFEKDTSNIFDGKNRCVNETLGICQQILLEFRQYAKESLTRIQILEESLIENGMVSKRKPKAAEVFEKSRMFLMSNRLPIKNKDDFDAFEKHILDDDFKEIAVSVFTFY